MRLTDLMSGADLTIFPIIALVLFLLVYATAVRRTYSRHRRPDLDRLATLPLESTDAPAPPSA